MEKNEEKIRFKVFAELNVLAILKTLRFIGIATIINVSLYILGIQFYFVSGIVSGNAMALSFKDNVSAYQAIFIISSLIFAGAYIIVSFVKNINIVSLKIVFIMFLFYCMDTLMAGYLAIRYSSFQFAIEILFHVIIAIDLLIRFARMKAHASVLKD